MDAQASPAAAVPDHVPAQLLDAFDLWDDAEMVRDPFGSLERLQERTIAKGGIVYNPYLRTWWVGGYEFAREVYEDADRFSSHVIAGGIQRPNMSGMSHSLPFRLIPLELDPPEHETFKRVLTPIFSPKEMRRQVPFIQATVRELVAEMAQGVEADVAASLSNPAPALLFTRMFGLPAERGLEYMEWNHRFFHSKTEEDRGEAIHQIIDAMTELSQRCLDDPQDDIMSQVVQAKLDGKPISFNDALGIGFLLYIGSLDTTTSHLNFQFLHMATHPEDQRLVRENPELAEGAAEECLRLYGMVNQGRTVARDIDFHGVQLKAGEKIGWSSSATGRDAAEFPDPHNFDPNRRANRHLAFGVGPHRCLGLHLARLVLKAAMEEVHAAIPQYRLATDRLPQIQTGVALGVNELPITWAPEGSAGAAVS